MSLVSNPKLKDDVSVRQAIAKLGSIKLGPTSTPKYANITLTDLTANSLIYPDSNKLLTSLGAATDGQLPIGDTGGVPVLATISGTANEIDVTNGAGTITIGIVNPLIVAKGGTGVATLTDHGILLGSGTGAITPLGAATNGQLPIGSTGVDPVLATLTAGAGLVVTNGAGSITVAVDGLLEDLDTLGANSADSEIIVGTAAGALAWESGATARTSLGLGTGDSPQFTGIELGHASDTTITRASAGNLNIEGNLVYRAGGTDVPIGDGGTGQSTAQAAIDALSAVSGATDEYVLTKDTASGNATWKISGTGGSPDYTAVSGNDANTDVSGAELETLTDGSLTALHNHTPNAHTHDGDTLQLDGINSDGGTFNFTTAVAINFNHSLVMADGTTIGQSAGPLVRFDDTNNFLEITGCKVGIGLITPLAALHVSGDGNAVNAALISNDDFVQSRQAGASNLNIAVASGTSAHRGVFKAVKSAGTLGTPTVPAENDYVFSLLGAIYDGVNTEGTAAIDFYVDGAVSENVCPQRISFVTSATNAAGRTERMVIKNTGEVQIKKSLYLLERAGNLASITAYGQIWAKNTAPCELWFTDDIGGDYQLGKHDSLSGFVANEHIDHTGVTLTAGTGLDGGGDISAGRTFNVDVDGLDEIGAALVDGDTFIVDDGDGGTTKKCLMSRLTTYIGAGATHAILDGSVHTDSVADGVTRGSIIYGNATPKWDELVIGAADTFLGSDGTDISYRTAAQVMASLSGDAAAAFDFNAQNLTSVGTIGCGVITQSGTTLANTYHAKTTVGIADNNLVEMDDADAADDDYAKFTANGLEGRSYAEVRSDLSLSDIGARVYRSSTQSINTGAATAISFDSENYDTDTIHEGVTNPTRLTCKTAGKYRISGGFDFDIIGAGKYAWGYLYLNGTTIIGDSGFGTDATYYPRIGVSTEYDLSINDYIELFAFQDSGVAKNVLAAGATTKAPHLEMRKEA